MSFCDLLLSSKLHSSMEGSAGSVEFGWPADDSSAGQFLGAELDFVLQFALYQPLPEFLEFVVQVVNHHTNRRICGLQVLPALTAHDQELA